MAFLSELWLAVLVAAAAVFVVSSVIHMVLPIHNGECKPAPDEEGLRTALRQARLLPGNTYNVPCPASMSELGSPDMVAKYREGPVVRLVVAENAPPAIGRSLLQWFLYSVGIGLFTAYLTRLALPPGAAYLNVFRVAGTAAVLGYAAGDVQDSIWKGRPWGSTLRYVFDGLVYGLVTAGVFAAFWPA